MMIGWLSLAMVMTGVPLGTGSPTARASRAKGKLVDALDVEFHRLRIIGSLQGTALPELLVIAEDEEFNSRVITRCAVQANCR